jgi:cytochrome c biogenesis protein CcdA
MKRQSQAFEAQFRWEVDRWVFRYRQRGTPVEVTELERERLIAVHRARLATAARLTIVTMFAIAFTAGLGLQNVVGTKLMALAYFGSVLMITLGLNYWATQAVTLHLQKRRPVGEKLGFLGAWMMRVEAMTWGEVIAGCFAAPLCVLIGATMNEGLSVAYRLSVYALAAFAVLIMTLVVVVKLMVDWRERRRRSWRKELDEVRSLRMD